MLRLLPLALVLLLGGCDTFGSDTGDADLTLSGSRSGTIQGSAYIGTGATLAGQSVTMRDESSGRTVTVEFREPIGTGPYRVGSEAEVRYSPGVLSDGFTGVTGTVTIAEVSPGEVRGSPDVGASLSSGDPILQITGTFRAVDRS